MLHFHLIESFSGLNCLDGDDPGNHSFYNPLHFPTLAVTYICSSLNVTLRYLSPRANPLTSVTAKTKWYWYSLGWLRFWQNDCTSDKVGDRGGFCLRRMHFLNGVGRRSYNPIWGFENSILQSRMRTRLSLNAWSKTSRSSRWWLQNTVLRGSGEVRMIRIIYKWILFNTILLRL